jgi:type III secretion system chaperone SycN
MNWVNQTLAEFGVQIGITDLSFGKHGVAQLILQSGGLLAVEPVHRGDIEEVLVYMGQPIGFDAEKKIRKALCNIHYLQNTQLPIQLATLGVGSDAMLIALVRISERDFTLPVLGHAFDYLNRWFEKI